MSESAHDKDEAAEVEASRLENDDDEMAAFLDGFGAEAEEGEPTQIDDEPTPLPKGLKRAEIVALLVDRSEETGFGNNEIRRMKKAELEMILEQVGVRGEPAPIGATFSDRRYTMPPARKRPASPEITEIPPARAPPSIAQRIAADPAEAAVLARFGGMMTVEITRFMENATHYYKPMGYVVEGAADDLEAKRPVVDQLIGESIEAGELDEVVAYFASPLSRLGLVIAASMGANARRAAKENRGGGEGEARPPRPPPVFRPDPPQQQPRQNNIADLDAIWEEAKQSFDEKNA